MNFKILPIIGIASAIFLGSCKQYKDVAYFQNIPDTDSAIMAENFQIPTSEFEDIILQPDNLVQVSITTLESALGATSLGSNSGMGGANASNNTNGQTTLNTGESTATGYLIDKNGNITIPLLGEIHLSGLTTIQAKELIYAQAKKFYKDPVITLRLSNFKINVMGEVAHPGPLIIPTEQANLLDVITLAGDLTIDGQRTDVLIMRKEGKKYLKPYKINLTSTEFMKSPYFYVKQGDVIYVKPNRNKASQADNMTYRNYALYASFLGVAVSVANMIIIIKNK